MCRGLRGSRPMINLFIYQARDSLSSLVNKHVGLWGDWSSCPGKLFLCQTFLQLAEYNFTKCDSDTSPNVSQSFPIDFLTIFVLSGKGTWSKGVKVVVEFVKLCPKVLSNFLSCSGTSSDDGQCRTGCDGTGCQCSSALPIHTQVICLECSSLQCNVTPGPCQSGI